MVQSPEKPKVAKKAESNQKHYRFSNYNFISTFFFQLQNIRKLKKIIFFFLKFSIKLEYIFSIKSITLYK